MVVVVQALNLTGARYFLLAAPGGLTGHGSSWTYRFANLYAQCLHRFFLGQIDSQDECETPEIDENAYQNWATREKLTTGQFKMLAAEEMHDLMQGKAACRYVPGSGRVSSINCHIWDRKSRTRGFINEFDRLILTRDIIEWDEGGFCSHNGLMHPSYSCGEVYLIDEDLIAITGQVRDSIFWYRIVDRDRVEDKYKQAAYLCSHAGKLDPIECVKTGQP